MNKQWGYVPLQNLCQVFDDGDWIETKDQSATGIRLVQTGNVGEGYFKDRADKARYIDDNTFERLNCEEIFPGDILISRLPDPVGRCCVIPETSERMVTAVDCTIVRLKPDKIRADFFKFYSLSKQYLDDIHYECTGTTRKRISRKKLGKISIPCPSLEEQKRIVAILDEAFEGIEKAQANAKKNLANARELFESYRESLFTQKRESWTEKTLKEVCVLQRGFDLPTRLRKAGDVPLVSSSGIIDHVHEKKVDGPGVATGRSGSIGNVFFIKEDFWPLNTVLYIKEFYDNEPEFVYYLLKRFDLSQYASGVGVPTLNRNHVHDELVRVPESKEKQREIVQKLGAMYEYTENLASVYKQKLKALAELKQSLLQKAFSGELTTEDATETREEATA